MKSIDAICVTSSYVKRQQILFDEVKGVILDVGDLKITKPDFIFSDDCLLFAGMGDVHIHAREDISQKHVYKEDFNSALKAMLNGGVIHAGDMPNNPIPPIDDDSYFEKMNLSHKCHSCIWHYAGIGPETNPLSLKVPYKAYMGPSVGELFFKDNESLDQALSRYENQWVSFHCEDPDILEKKASADHHHLRRPIEAEVLATQEALKLIKKYSLHGKLCHYSSGEGLGYIRKARKEGLKVQIEVTPQHLYFDMESIPEERWLEFQMNPPIRSRDDRGELFLALQNNEIDFLATDHAPHTKEEKQKGTSGLTGLDTYGGFVTWLIKEGISLETVAKVCSENPGKFYNEFRASWDKLFPGQHGSQKGFLKSGFEASFTILNLSKPYIVSKNSLETKVKQNPFVGIMFPGSVEKVFIKGKTL